MAIVFDAQGNLVDTEGRINFAPEGSDVLPPNPFTSPGTADDAYANLLGLPANQDMGFLYGVPQTADDQGYFVGLPGTADDVFPFEPPGTADDRIANLISVPGTADDVFPFAPKNRLGGLDLNRFEGIGTLGVANEEDVEQIESLGSDKPSGIEKLLEFLIPGSFLKNIKQDPRATGIRNFYGPQGLTSTGSVASGIMQGYNPVSGGFLNMITGGKYGRPTQYGLAGAMQRRIENILGRRAPQTDASRAKVAELRDLQLREMKDRADRGESLSSIGRSTFSGPGMAFEQKGGGFSVKSDGSKRFYGGR